MKLLFILKDNYSAFLSSYSCLCLSSNDEKTNLKRQGEVWIKLPTEIIPNRLYLVRSFYPLTYFINVIQVHQDTHSIMTSIAPKLLSIESVVYSFRYSLLVVVIFWTFLPAKCSPTIYRRPVNLPPLTLPSVSLIDRTYFIFSELSAPDPQLRVDPQSRSSVSVVVSDGPLEMIVEELYRRISITGTKTLVCYSLL